MKLSVFRHLDPEPLEVATRDRIWHQIEQRRLRSSVPRERFPPWRAVSLIAAAAAIVIAVGGLGSQAPSWRAPAVTTLRAAPVQSESAVPRADLPPVPSPVDAPPRTVAVAPEAVAVPLGRPAQLRLRALQQQDSAARAAAYASTMSSAQQVDALLGEANAARARADVPAAWGALDRIVTEHAADPRAGLAAFTMGRLALDRVAAQRAFTRALDLGLPARLEADARLRLAELAP